MIKVILFIAVFGLFLVLLRSFLRGGRDVKRKLTLRIMVIGLVLLSLWLVVTGKIMGLLALAPVIGLWGHRLFQVWHVGRMVRGVFKGKKGPRQNPSQAGQTEAVKTQTLEVYLDQKSMIVDAVVLTGLCRGFALTDLPLGLIYDVYEYCQLQDSQGADALDNFMTNRHGPGWQIQAQKEAETGTLSQAQSRILLGAQDDDSNAHVKKRYYDLMQNIHPDRGGSARLTARLNQAKEMVFKG